MQYIYSFVYNWSSKSSGILQIVIDILRPSFTDLFVRHAEIPESHAIYTPWTITEQISPHMTHSRTQALIHTYSHFLQLRTS